MVRGLALPALWTSLAAVPVGPPADLVLRGGVVHTVEPGQPRAEAVAVRDGRIVAVGASAEAASWIGPKTRVLELGGRAVVPGFVEGHAHLLGIGFVRHDVDLRGATSFDEVLARVASAIGRHREGEWIRGRGWHEGHWPRPTPGAVRGFPTHERLSALTPRNPVVLERADGHAVLVNARAMELRGVDRATRAPAGGEVVRDSSGEATGVFVDNARSLVEPPARTTEENAAALARALEECHANGITSFTDAGATNEVIALYRAAAAKGGLRLRLHVMAEGLVTMRGLGRPEVAPAGGFLAVRAVKLYADGALGSRGAALLRPYTDDPGNSGLLLHSQQEILDAAREALRAGFQLGTHAIGDRANRIVLDAYARAFADHPRAEDARFRVEHAQVLAAEDIPRFGRMGVIAAMQAVHCPSDRPWAVDRLGPERIRGAYAWRSLLASGARIVNGTDAPVEGLSPIRNFHASVTRQDAHGRPAGGFDPEQKLTRLEALRTLTLDGAYGSFRENEIGSIAPGKLADLAVLSQDILAVPDDALLATEVVATIVGGAIVFARPESAFTASCP